MRRMRGAATCWRNSQESNNKCVKWELRSSPPNRGAVRRADVLLQTTCTYVTSDVCDQKCDGPTNAWVSWKTISVPWVGRDYWHGGRANYSNKPANHAKYSNCKSWITRLMTSAYKICDRCHFEFCLHFEFYFYPFSICLQAKHDVEF